MSLTSILRDKKKKEVKEWFKNHFANPGMKEKREILVSPKQVSAAYSGEIGTAFDYLMRFNLERINNEYAISKDYWVAGIAFQSLLSFLQKSENENISIGFYKDKQVNRLAFIDFLEKEFKQAEGNYEQFIKDGKMTRDLIKSSVFLAKLDTYVRQRIIDADLDNIEMDKVEELERLFDIVPWDAFKAKKHCFLNPEFGEGSALVGGADADLVIDNVLIDIKSSKNLTIERGDLNQIIGYYLLSLIGGFNDKDTEEIKEIGIYFARYGYFWKMPVSDYYDEGAYKERVDEFKLLMHEMLLK